MIWLSDGVDLGDGEAFINALNERVPAGQLTVIAGAPKARSRLPAPRTMPARSS